MSLGSTESPKPIEDFNEAHDRANAVYGEAEEHNRIFGGDKIDHESLEVGDRVVDEIVDDFNRTDPEKGERYIKEKSVKRVLEQKMTLEMSKDIIGVVPRYTAELSKVFNGEVLAHAEEITAMLVKVDLENAVKLVNWLVEESYKTVAKKFIEDQEVMEIFDGDKQLAQDFFSTYKNSVAAATSSLVKMLIEKY